MIVVVGIDPVLYISKQFFSNSFSFELSTAKSGVGGKGFVFCCKDEEHEVVTT